MDKIPAISPRQTARNIFFICYREKEYSELVEKVNHARAWEEGNHAVNAELDVILGLALRRLGRETEALSLLLRVVNSQHASNADKIAANACLSIRFMEKGDEYALEAAMHELDCLTPSSATSLWAAKALADLSGAFAAWKDFDNAKKIFNYAVGACQTLKRSDETYLRTTGKEIMDEIVFVYATEALIPQKKLRQAEKYLTYSAVNYCELGMELEAALCYGYLSQIAFAEKRKEEAVLFKEKSWEILSRYREEASDLFLDASVVLWLLAKNAGWDGDRYLLELFERYGLDDPEKELEAVRYRKLSKKIEAGLSRGDEHD